MRAVTKTALAVNVALALHVAGSPTTHDVRSPSGGTTNTIIQMFEWSWDSIAKECTDFIGPAGYTYIQASPAQEHVQGPQWWTIYQPVSYSISSRHGSREQYANMIQTCGRAGVKIIADTVLNHMSALDNGTGTGGSSFTKYGYPSVPYTSDNFHHNGQLVDYTKKENIWTQELVGLADLATDTEYVRAKEAAYVNDLLSLGVAGLRLDAAKHMNPDDIKSVLSRLNGKPYVSQEVVYGASDAVQPDMYTGNGDVQEFRYTTAFRQAFLGNGSSISELQNLEGRGWLQGGQANVFVANHDTERTGDSLNYKSSNNSYILATVFSLAHPYGTPSVLSAYEFSSQDQGAPNSGNGQCSDNGGSNGWLCQHRFPAFAGMVGFRKAAGDASLGNWVSPAAQQIAFGRGARGYVAINNADAAWTSKFATSLPAGSYCNVINGAPKAGKCSGPAIAVGSDGMFSATVPARGALALHVGAQANSS